MAEQSYLDFGTEATIHLSYTVLYRNLGMFKNKGTFLWNFFTNSGLRKTSAVASVVKLIDNHCHFITLSISLCVQHIGHEAVRCGGLSVAAEFY